MIPVWVVVGQKTSKRHVYMIGGCLLTVAMALLNFIDARLLKKPRSRVGSLQPLWGRIIPL